MVGERVTALVLGGGYGTRLFANLDQEYMPKGLLEIGGVPAIDRALAAFESDSISKIILETNNEGYPHYSNWASRRAGSNIELFVEPISSPTNCLGVLETISYVNSRYQFEEPVLLIAPDNIFFEPQIEFVTAITAPVHLLSYKVDNLEEASNYGVLTVEGARVTSCIEKPANPQSKIIRTACEIWTPQVFERLKDWISTSNSDNTGDFLGDLIRQGVTIKQTPVRGKWIDIGNERNLKEARELWH